MCGTVRMWPQPLVMRLWWPSPPTIAAMSSRPRIRRCGTASKEPSSVHNAAAASPEPLSTAGPYWATSCMISTWSARARTLAASTSTVARSSSISLIPAFLSAVPRCRPRWPSARLLQVDVEMADLAVLVELVDRQRVDHGDAAGAGMTLLDLEVDQAGQLGDPPHGRVEAQARGRPLSQELGVLLPVHDFQPGADPLEVAGGHELGQRGPAGRREARFSGRLYQALQGCFEAEDRAGQRAVTVAACVVPGRGHCAAGGRGPRGRMWGRSSVVRIPGGAAHT